MIRLMLSAFQSIMAAQFNASENFLKDALPSQPAKILHGLMGI